jgi:elongation factor Ts
LVEITAELVKELRQRTGVGLMDCKRALSETSGDLDKAIDELRKSGVAKAAKRSGREASEGLVESYIHPGGRVGVLLEINCETDFVARTEDFQTLVRNMAMHIAAASPLVVTRAEVDGGLVEKERAIFSEQLKLEGKPAEMVERIVDGKIEKFYEEIVLLEQPYVRDDKKKVEVVVNEAIAKLGENIVIRRFQRFALGQE